MKVEKQGINKRLTRYHRVNLVFGCLILTFAVTTLARAAKDLAHSQVLLDGVVVAAFSLLFFVLFLLPDKHIFRKLQVSFVFVLSGAYKLLVTPYEIGWVLLLVIGVSLMYRYGMLQSGVWVRLGAVVFFSLIATGAAVIMYDRVTLYLSINQVAIGIASIFLTYYLFEDDFLRAKRARDQLQEESEENRPFVAFGQHAAGVVHDLKNDVNLVTAYSTLLSMKARDQEPLTEEDADRLAQYVDRIKARIDLVRYASSSGARVEEHINLQKVCRAASYIFEIRPEYRRVINFRVLVEDQSLYVYGSRAALLSILENLISNSCEAMIEAERDGSGGMTKPKQVTITASSVNGSVLITVSDTGPGIKGCRDCEEDNCLDCGQFRIGHTTKSDGSGLGIFSVRRQVQRLEGSFRISSPEVGGLVAQVVLPRSEPKVRIADPAPTSEG